MRRKSRIKYLTMRLLCPNFFRAYHLLSQVSFSSLHNPLYRPKLPFRTNLTSVGTMPSQNSIYKKEVIKNDIQNHSKDPNAGVSTDITTAFTKTLTFLYLSWPSLPSCYSLFLLPCFVQFFFMFV